MDQYIQVILTTKNPRYAVPCSPVTVSSTVGAKELNKLVNDLLTESGHASATEFCFLIDNEFLNSSVGEYLEEKDFSLEVVTIEFFEKQKAPVYHTTIDQDDLISSVKRAQSYVLTGSYDGTLQVWSLNDITTAPLLKVELDEKVKCIEWLCLDSLDGHTAIFVTGGFDQTVRLWLWDMQSSTATCLAVCRGHSQTVMTATAMANTVGRDCPDLFATGSWDGTIKLWSASPESTDLSEETGGIAHTRKSVDKTPIRIPKLTLAGHRETVTRISHWPPVAPSVAGGDSQPSNGNSPQLISVSWDHTLRLWDYNRRALCAGDGSDSGKQCTGGSELRCIVSGHAFHDADGGVGGILTASSDNRVRIYDLRANEALAQVGFQGHTAWLTSVAWAPHRTDQFVTGSIDRSVRLWDTRNPNASLYDLMGHTDIVTDVDWAPPAQSTRLSDTVFGAPTPPEHRLQHYILSSSGDATVKVYRYPPE